MVEWFEEEAHGEALAPGSAGEVEIPTVSEVQGGSSRVVDPARDDSCKRKGSEEELTEEEMEYIQSLRGDSKRNMVTKKKNKVKDQSGLTGFIPSSLYS